MKDSLGKLACLCSACRGRAQGFAGEQIWNNLNGVKDFRTDNGSGQGQNLALTGVFVPSSLDSGLANHDKHHARVLPYTIF